MAISYPPYVYETDVKRKESRVRDRALHVILPVGGDRIAFRCDGNERIGAGHVARCIPLAKAFAQLGWKVSFVGEFQGLARWLLGRADIPTRAPNLDAPCGLLAEDCEVALLDSYAITPSSICELAHTLPVVTIAEANRCPTRGVLLDYHLDRNEPSSARLLAGPSFAPLDPALAGAGRAADQIRSVLVTMGGSLPARDLLTQIAQMVRSVFSDAHIVLAGTDIDLARIDLAVSEVSRASLDPADSDMVLASGERSETIETSESRVIQLPSPSALLDVLPHIDLAVTAAGWTAYELACAGIPQVAIAVVANQRRVVKGLTIGRLAHCLDLTNGDSLTDLPPILTRLADPDLRRHLAARGKQTFDGQGAQRAASKLTARYRASKISDCFP
jgi:spore coat polysaccharide biosynthesis predicted glycosyltransferase SpsG